MESGDEESAAGNVEEPTVPDVGDAVSTFEELQAAINDASGTMDAPTEIKISGSIQVTEKLTIDGKHVRLTGGGTLTCAGLDSYPFFITGNGSLTLENVTLDGSGHTPPQDSKANYNLVYVASGELVLNDGAVLENNGDTAVYMAGSSAVLTMNGGAIRNNTDARSTGSGGAIFTPDNSDGYAPTISINGGEISGNSVGGNGGAIYLTNYANLAISGGEISGNSAGKSGGAIYVNSVSTGNRDAVNISGGTIADNKVGDTGVGANIYTERDILLGPDANIPSGVKLYNISGVARMLILTGTPKHTIGLEAVGSGSSGNWLSVAKMQDGSAVSEDAFRMLTMTDPSQSLVLADDGTVRIGTKRDGDHPLDLTYYVWNSAGTSGADNGTVGSQSGNGWSWDASTLTLTITDDVRAISNNANITALSLPKGDVKIDIAAGKTLTVESPDWYALSCLGSLTITGGGTIKTVSGGNYTGGISTVGTLSISDTTLDIAGTSQYFLLGQAGVTLQNCGVTVTGSENGGYGIATFDGDIVIEDCDLTENEVAFGMFGQCDESTGKIQIKNSSVSINDVSYGIVGNRESVDIADSQLAIACSIGIHTQGSKTDETVTINDSAGFIGIDDAESGYNAIEVGIKDGTASTDGRIGINNLDDKYQIAQFEEQDDDGELYYYAVVKETEKGQTYYLVLGTSVTGITLNKESLNLIKGDSERLKATVEPAEATNQRVTWTSSDESIATVDENGTVTAVAPGTATITAATENGGFTATCTVTVKAQSSGGGSGSGGGGSSSFSPVAIGDASHGSVESDRTWTASGAIVTITVTPDDGYELDKLTVTDSQGNELSLTDEGEGRYSFRMPNGKVTVEATFKETSTEHICPSPAFPDLDATAWYHEAVDYALSSGMMNGYDNGLFGPDDSLSRAMVCQVLYNLEDKPSSGQSSFGDVPDDAWYTQAVAWAESCGVVSGYGNGSFGPDDAITREQLATVLWNYARYKGYDTTQGGMAIREFPDCGDISDFAVEPMGWAVNVGLLHGYDDGRLGPRDGATRAQVAMVLMRFVENLTK